MRMLHIILVKSVLLLLVLTGSAAAGEVTASYLYNLSDFDGVVPYDSARVFVDETRGETYVVTSGGTDIYNSTGMQIFHFDYDREIGSVYDAAVDSDGAILLLVAKEGKYRIVRCNYRGEPVSSVNLKNLPADFETFRPGKITCRAGVLYLVSLVDMQVVEVDADGSFVKGYDFATLMGMTEKERTETGFGQFSVAPDGAMLFTIPSDGKAYRVLPDGTGSQFGKRGSTAGKFGVPYGIAADKAGNILVTDKLRGVVMIFNAKFDFMKEFGFRGLRPGNLIVPNEIAVDSSTGRVYVSQMRRRGVSIYQIGAE